MLPLFQSVVKDNFCFERNRLLRLGYQLAGTKARTVLDDARLRFLGGFCLGHLGLVTLSGELSGVGLLAVLTFLDNLCLTRGQSRVFANFGLVRDRNCPGHVLGALSRFGADHDNLVNRIQDTGPATIRVHGFRARLALSFNLVGACGNGGVVLVFNLERNLTLRYGNNVDHSGGDVLRTVFICDCDRDLDLVTWLRSAGRLGDHVTLVVQANDPVAVIGLQRIGRVAKLIRVTGGSEVFR